MNFLSKLTGRVHKLARYIEHPHLWRLRQQGVVVDSYLQLDRKWLQSLGIATVLDIGANVGQFCQMAHELWPRARIYSFEPLQDCFEQLKTRMAGTNNVTAFNVGLGEEHGEKSFERNAFSASSSFLKMGTLHQSLYPQTRESQTVTVKMERLDDIAKELKLIDALLIKVDVQGYEDRVLLGGEQTVRRAQVILIETSFQPLYESQLLFGDIHGMLSKWGFSYAGAIAQEFSPEDERVVQADSIFVRQPTA